MVNLAQLYELFNSIPSKDRCFYTDTFATCCFLHQQNKIKASHKLLSDLFMKINNISDQDQSVFLKNVIETMPGNEEKFALAVPLRSEIRTLFAT